jgi:anti-sigma B factor antagonist
MSTTTTTQLNTISISLAGKFDDSAVKALKPLLVQLSHKNSSNVIIEMSKVSFIDSTGVGAILYLFKKMAARGLELILIGPNGQPLKIMKQLQMNQSIPFFQDLLEYHSAMGRTLSIIKNSKSGIVL